MTLDSDRRAHAGTADGGLENGAPGPVSDTVAVAYAPAGRYSADKPRLPVLAGIVAIHLALFALAVSVRYEADLRERSERLATFSVSEPSPPPADKVEPENPAPAPLVTPPQRIALPMPNAVQMVTVPLDAKPPESAAPPVTVPVAKPAPPAPVTAPDFLAGQLNNPGPSYPYLSRKAHEEGVVLLRVLVSAEGSAKNLELEKSSGYSRLDKAALATVRKWRFLPARRAGEAVEAWVIVPVTFSLG